MDDSSIYQQILDLLTIYLPHSDMEPERHISSFLSNAGMIVAYTWIAISFLWLTTKSVLIKRTPFIYLLAASIFLCGMTHLGRIFNYPLQLQLSIDFIATMVSLTTAIVVHRQRHCLLSLVFQFKYLVGLFRNLERIDEVDTKR